MKEEMDKKVGKSPSTNILSNTLHHILLNIKERETRRGKQCQR